MIKRTFFILLEMYACLYLAGCATSVDAREAFVPSVATATPVRPSLLATDVTHPLGLALTTIPSLSTPVFTLAPTVLVETSSPTLLACWQAGGQVAQGSLETDLLPKPLDFRVYVPPCYDQEVARRYPVLYLIHGQSYNDDQWDRLGADETADVQIASGEAPPFLIVMPRDRHWGQPDEDLFGQVVADELVPYIDATYRTKPGRYYRAVGGLSRGAGWAVHLGLTRPDLFGSLGAHSLAVFHYDARYLRTWLDEFGPAQLPRIYLDIGDNDRPAIMDSAIWFEGLLTEKNVPHEWYLFQGYHEEAYWKAHLLQYLRWYTLPWKEDAEP